MKLPERIKSIAFRKWVYVDVLMYCYK